MLATTRGDKTDGQMPHRTPLGMNSSIRTKSTGASDRSRLSIVSSAGTFHLGGVDVFLSNLYRRLQPEGLTCRHILTNPDEGAPESVSRAEFPGGIVFLPKTNWWDVRQRQNLLRDQLLEARPCVYLPNYDFDMGGICPALPDEVIVVATLHSDEAVYYDFYRSFSRYWNHTVAVSKHIAASVSDLGPTDRISVIPCGVEVPHAPAPKTAGTLKVVYCGRLTRYQKRIDLLAQVINECDRKKLDIQFQIAGSGADAAEFARSISPAIAAGRARLLGQVPNREALELIAQSHVMILTSEFEGLPVLLLEAMSHGCVPVISAVSSGVGEVVRNEENGFLVPVGDVAGFVARLELLLRDRNRLTNMATRGFKTIEQGPYSMRHTAAKYSEIFHHCFAEVRLGHYHRPKGAQTIPKQYRFQNWLRLKFSRFQKKPTKPEGGGRMAKLE